MDTATPAPAIAHRVALHVLQLGALAVVLAAVPHKAFELDRFFVPKELVLHAIALVAGLACLAPSRTLRLSRVDQLLGVFLALGALSALFATNWWLAGRSLAVSLSGVSCFWSARVVARAGLGRPLVAALALAGVLGAVTSLMQTYGIRTELFSLNRAPGGTFGNRNFMAHLCVLTFPALLLTTLRADTTRSMRWWSAALAAVAAALVLSRSRAAWLALIVCALALVLFGILAFRRARGAVAWRRLALLALVVVAGGGLSLLLPNTLNWKSDSPYLETARSVVNYKEGSGQGRLVQYGNTARMTLRHPLLGVGPGNWSVDYPRFASRNDPSLAADGMTANPWPSSDWMAFLSERGPAALIVLVLAMLALAVDAVRLLRLGGEPEGAMAAWALLGTLAALVVVGSFDAVLLLPAPALVTWTLLGVLSAPSRPRRVVELALGSRALAVLLALVVGGLAVARSARQVSAMSVFSTTTRIASLERAALLDPGSYRIHLRLAETHARRRRCADVRSHAAAARDLFPNAAAPRRLLAACGR